MGWTRQILKTVLAHCVAPERLLMRGSPRRLTDRPTISLTFDDGPHAQFTVRVLEALQRWQIPATFFVIGQQAEHHPGLIRQIIEGGHELGNHTYFHREPREINAENFLAEVQDVRDLLQQWTPSPCTLMRPPKGELTWAKLRGLWDQQQSVVLWNVDPHDYRMPSGTEAEHWAERYRPRHGDILLLHDNRPAAARILETLGERGLFERFRVVPVSRWLKPSCDQPPSPPTSLMSAAETQTLPLRKDTQ